MSAAHWPGRAGGWSSFVSIQRPETLIPSLPVSRKQLQMRDSQDLPHTTEGIPQFHNPTSHQTLSLESRCPAADVQYDVGRTELRRVLRTVAAAGTAADGAAGAERLGTLPKQKGTPLRLTGLTRREIFSFQRLLQATRSPIGVAHNQLESRCTPPRARPHPMNGVTAHITRVTRGPHRNPRAGTPEVARHRSQ